MNENILEKKANDFRQKVLKKGSILPVNKMGDYDCNKKLVQMSLV